MQTVVLYRVTATALPLLQESQADALADNVAFHEPVVNTQSGTRYQAPLYGVSAVAIVPPRVAAVPTRFILRNSDCGVVVLLNDASKVDTPLAVEIPADGALLWRWPNEGVRLLARPDATDRTCLSGPLSGSLQCTNDNVCDGGVRPPTTARRDASRAHGATNRAAATSSHAGTSTRRARRRWSTSHERNENNVCNQKPRLVRLGAGTSHSVPPRYGER
jgi:hypothetical protein